MHRHNIVALFPAGPFYCYHMDMESISGSRITQTKFSSVTITGNVDQMEGKIGKALSLDGRRDYVDAGEQVWHTGKHKEFCILSCKKGHS